MHGLIVELFNFNRKWEIVEIILNKNLLRYFICIN